MRKKYESPKIFFDSFRLSMNIASGCEVLSTPAAAYICPVNDPELGGTIFTSDDVCDFTTPDIYDGVCYNVPLENHNVFES